MVETFRRKQNGHISLLFLIYDLERGGPELRLLDMQRRMPDDFRIFICATSTNTALLPEFLEAGGRIAVIPVKRGYLEIDKAWTIYRQYVREGISIINVFGLKEFFQAACVSFFSGFRIKIVYHAVGTFDHFQIHHKVLFRLLSKIAHSILCNSVYLRNQLRNLSVADSKIKIINNGIDTRLFDRSRYREKNTSEFVHKKKSFCIGTIANFREEKNYPFLIKAFSILIKRHPNLRLLCVGGGPLLKQVKRMSEKMGLEKQVFFTGYSKNVMRYLHLMNLFVLCSERESFPNVLLQAMSMEVPVLSAEIGGCVEIVVNGKNGMTYPPNDLNAFVGAVESLIQNKSLAARLSENGRKTIVESFDLDRMIKKYTEFFRVVDLN